MDRGSGRAQKCHQVVPGPKGLFPYNAHIPVPPNSLWTFIVGFTVSCAAACVVTLQLFPRLQPFSTILILLLGFERLFGAVHIWLVGDSPPRSARSFYVKTGPGDRRPWPQTTRRRGLRL